MSRRYYKRYRHKSSNILSLSKNERIWFRFIFQFIFELIRGFIYVTVEIIKLLWKTGKYIRRRIVNRSVLSKIGYSLDEVLDLVDRITPRQFEIFCAELFRSTGIYDNVEITKATNDYGKDCILTRSVNGLKEITFVECKHWRKDNNSRVGREICQKLLGSCQMHCADKAIIITTGLFHNNAYEVARKVNNLRLMDNMDIQRMILDLDIARMSKVMARTLNAS